jgi:hypothetical protein
VVRLRAGGLRPHRGLATARHRIAVVADGLVEDATHVVRPDEGPGFRPVAEGEVVEHLRDRRVCYARIQVGAGKASLHGGVAPILGQVALDQLHRELAHPARLGDSGEGTVGELVARVVGRSLVELVPRVARPDPGDLVTDGRERGVDSADPAGHDGLGPVHGGVSRLCLFDVLLHQRVGVVDIQEAATAQQQREPGAREDRLCHLDHLSFSLS